MLDTFWLLIAGLLIIIGLISQQVPLLLIALLFLLTSGVSRLWKRYCLARVEYQRQLSARRVFFGEEVHLEIDISNRKPLPLPWLEIKDDLPHEVTLPDTATSLYELDRQVLSELFSLGWYQKIKRRYRLQCQQRGYFTFGPARLSSGDPFGFSRQEATIPETDALIVYPRILPVEKLGISSKQPVGDVLTKRDIFPDPILTATVRDYQSGDSLRHIHWKSTGRLGKLQTKVFETTSTVDLSLFLDVRTVAAPAWSFVARLLELGIITAASVASHALAQGYRVGLFVNQRGRLAREFIRFLPSQHPDQLLDILEALASVHPTESLSMARLIHQEGRNLPWGSTLVVLSAAPDDTLLTTLVRMKRAGRSVALVQIGGIAPLIDQHGVPVHHVRDEVLWSELEQIRITGR